MFHMPAFVFLAGVTAKPTHLPKRIGTFLVILAVFQSLYFIEVHLIGLNKTFSLLIPFWILWFLLAMCWWQLLMPVIRKFPRVSIAVSLLTAIFSGTFEPIGYDLTLSRTLVFLPFFVLGATHGQSILRAAYRLSRVAEFVAVLVIGVAWTYLYLQNIRPGWLYGSFSFERLKVEDETGILIRIGLMIIAMLVVFAFVSLTPGSNAALVALGRRSLAIFVLHGFVVLAVTPLMPIVLQKSGNFIAVGICLLLTVLTVAIFALPVFDRTIRRISQGTVSLISKPFETRNAS